jgi:hypothetical protein
MLQEIKPGVANPGPMGQKWPAETFRMAWQYVFFHFPPKQEDISPKKMEFLALLNFLS